MRFQVYVKAGVIILVALLLVIPLGMIAGVVYERSEYRKDVIHEIERTWTGTQRVAGPVLSVPYLVDVTEPFTNKATGLEETRTRRLERHLYRVPETLDIKSTVETESRSRGIYTVPVYTSEHVMKGEFDTSQLKTFAGKTQGFVRWGQPELSLMVSDIRGISGRPELTWNGHKHAFSAGSSVPNFTAGVHAEIDLTEGATRFPVEITLNLRGSQELSYAPLAGDLSTELISSWPHPKFDGQFLPAKREITDSGFAAQWRMSSFATDALSKLNDCAYGGKCYALDDISFGVKFFEPVDIYVKVNRAIKYGALFIVLTFVAFFLTETLTQSRLHPLQYALVGLALAVFYLLLVSLSEHLSFATAYVLATVACVALIGVYLRGALGQKRLASWFGAGIALLYAMLYLILRSEDFALLMGSLLVFAMLAAVMVLTRRIDWYNLSAPSDPVRAKSAD